MTSLPAINLKEDFTDGHACICKTYRKVSKHLEHFTIRSKKIRKLSKIILP